MENKKYKGILILILNLFLFGCTILNNNNSKYGLYENYSGKAYLPEITILESSHIVSDSVLFEVAKIEQLINQQEIKGKLFDFLCNLDIVNGRNFFNADTIEYTGEFQSFVSARKNDLKLYLVGKIELSNAFESYLILSIDGPENRYNSFRNLYLMNVKNNKCISLTKTTDFSLSDGQCDYIYTKRLLENHFEMRRKNISSDVILPENAILYKDYLLMRFKYNNKGKLIKLK